MVASMFANSNPEQRAGILNHLVSAVGPGTLGSGALAGLGALIRGGNNQVTPEQAAEIAPTAVQELATHAEKQDPSVVDRASQFYSQHPKLVQALGAGSLALIMSHISKR
jgi:hypothetical protein